jgi:hypothetical protein
VEEFVVAYVPGVCRVVVQRAHIQVQVAERKVGHAGNRCRVEEQAGAEDDASEPDPSYQFGRVEIEFIR